MANLRKRRSSDLCARVSARLPSNMGSGARVRLGLSGGRDSVVLLAILAELSVENNFVLECVHVHHGISPKADQWAEFCATLCATRGLRIDIVRVKLGDLSAKGLEATARAARYAVLFREGADFVLTAHHLQDQAETVLLQLLRGSGAKGLAAMSRSQADNYGGILRPLLDEAPAELLAFAESAGLQWIEDESNEDTRFRRNFIRHEVLPRVEARFPGATRAIARSAAHLAETQGLLEELATIDLAAIGKAGGLDVGCLSGLNGARAKNVLRTYFSQNSLEMPQTAHLEELLRQIKSARPDGALRVKLGNMNAQIHKGILRLVTSTNQPASSFEVRWAGEAVLPLPHLGGALSFSPGIGAGVSVEKLAMKPVTVRLRIGGERMRMASHRPLRTLKNLLREAGMPYWTRGRLPLLYCGDELAFVPGIGVASDYRAGVGEPSMVLEWAESFVSR